MVRFTSEMIGAVDLAWGLSCALLVVMVVQSGSGVLFHESIYWRDSSLTASAWRANDLVTLFVASPLLLFCLNQGSSSSLAFWDDDRSKLDLWMGALFYPFYSATFYLLGAPVNELFFAYVSMWALSVWAFVVLVFGVASPLSVLHGDAGEEPSVTRYRSRFAAVCLGTIGVLIGAMCLAGYAMLFAVGSLPFSMEMWRLTAATDLAILVPFLCVSAYWLWVGNKHGLMAGTVCVVGNASYLPVVALMGPFSAMRGIHGPWMTFLPIWIAIDVVYIIVTFSLVKTRTVVQKCRPKFQ